MARGDGIHVATPSRMLLRVLRFCTGQHLWNGQMAAIVAAYIALTR